MANSVTVQGGTKNGTSKNDDLNTYVITYSGDTTVHTYYKRLNGKAGNDTLFNNGSVASAILDGGKGNDTVQKRQQSHNLRRRRQ